MGTRAWHTDIRSPRIEPRQDHVQVFGRGSRRANGTQSELFESNRTLFKYILGLYHGVDFRERKKVDVSSNSTFF